jgi:hypothetical protein
MERLEPYNKVAKIVVEELNSVERIEGMLWQLDNMSTEELMKKTERSGLVCGDNCTLDDGLICGSKCPSTKGIVGAKDQYAIDVLGKKGITENDRAAIRTDPKKFHEAVTAEVTERLSLKRM